MSGFVGCNVGLRVSQHIDRNFVAPITRRSSTADVTVSAPPVRRARYCLCSTSSSPEVESVYERVISSLPLSTVFQDALGDDALHPTSEPDSFKAVCPFHEDKNPSLHLSDSKKVWHCFGCQASGNLFSFEKRFRSLETVPQALQSLAARYEIVARIVKSTGQKITTDVARRDNAYPPPPQRPSQIPLPKSREWGRLLSEKRTISSVLNATSEYFRSRFTESEEAKSYAFSRLLSSKTVELFDIGFAPASDTMDDCLTYLTGKGFDADSCVLAGVAKRGKEGRVYDTFRDRLMIPIRGKCGEIVSFAGRLLVDSETAPKYLNGSNNALFQKKDTLFGLDIMRNADSAIREYGMVVLVEGYMDVMAVHDKSDGKLACVATMGTAMCEDQIRAACDMLKDPCDGKVIVNLDGDEAGLAAAERLCESVLCGMTEVQCVYIAQPPQYFKDVGEYLETPNKDIESYIRHLEDSALPWIEWRVRRIIQMELDGRAAVMTDVDVAQAAELAALGEAEASFRLTNDISWDSTSGSAKLFELVQRGSEALLQDWSGVNTSNEDRTLHAPPQNDGFEKQAAKFGLSPGARKSQEFLSTSHETQENSDGRIAGCPRELLDEVAAFLSKALPYSPGVNLEWLVHCWACSLCDGITRRIPVLYEAFMGRIDAHCESWRRESPVGHLDIIRLGPWDYDEKKRPSGSRFIYHLQEMEQEEADEFFKSKANMRRTDECIRFEQKIVIPLIEKMRSPVTRKMTTRPRAAAEEMILRALLKASESKRLEALDKLLSVMIRMEETDLFPFWTSASRDTLFQHLVELTGDPTVEEIAADCEAQDWWNYEIELLFFETEEFGDKELVPIRELEVIEPVVVVEMASSAIHEMARKAASGRAIDKLSAFMEQKLRALTNEDNSIARSQQEEAEEQQRILDEVTGLRYLNSEEREEHENAMKAAKAKSERQRLLLEMEQKLLRGEYMELDEETGDKDSGASS